jgi:hypothetical protein
VRRSLALHCRDVGALGCQRLSPENSPFRSLVGCSRNPLTTRFPALLEELPQVKRGTSHTRERLGG